MRTVKMLVLSPLVTAARASAPTAPAASRSSRSNPEPTSCWPVKASESRRKARRFLSRMATEWPSACRAIASPEPTRPHPTTTTCTRTVQHGPSGVVKNRPGRCPCAMRTGPSGRLAYCDAVSGRTGGDIETGSPPGVGGEPRPAPPIPARPAPPPKAPLAMSIDAAAQFPETFRYRLKNKLLGPPLVSEQLTSERLSRPIALGVLAPDCISSSAYGTEETLTQLVPAIGLAAFTLVVPIMIAILGVLFFVTLSYLEVIQRYTKAGGAYVVARDNFGPQIAQIAAVALLIDYTVTVAVQTAAGTDALTSAFPRLVSYTVPISVGVVLILLYGNLRGIREAGKLFAIPTYFFVFSLSAVIVVGYVRAALGRLHPHPTPPVHLLVDGHLGHAGSGLLMGLAFITLLRAFAHGGARLDRVGGDLQRRGQLPQARGLQRQANPRHDELGARIPPRRCHPAGQMDPRHPLRGRLADGHLTRGPLRPGHERSGQVPLLRGPGGHAARPLHGGQHQLQRVSVSGQFRRRRPILASPAHPPG